MISRQCGLRPIMYKGLKTCCRSFNSSTNQLHIAGFQYELEDARSRFPQLLPEGADPNTFEPLPAMPLRPETVPLTTFSFPQLEPKALVHYPSSVFHQTVRMDVLHRATLFDRNYFKHSAISVPNRSEMVGTRRKVWQQKGTGRARHGDKFAPQFHGGGKCFGPKPRSFRQGIPMAMYQTACQMALAYRYQRNELFIVEDELNMELPFLLKALKELKWTEEYGTSVMLSSLPLPLDVMEASKKRLVPIITSLKENASATLLLRGHRLVIQRKAMDYLVDKYTLQNPFPVRYTELHGII